MTAIVVLNYNDWRTTKEYIEMIRDYQSIDYIIIVDNASTDESYKMLTHLSDNKTILLRSNINGGYSSGNNIGAKYAIDNLGVDNIIISNPDIMCKDEDIKKVLLLLNSKEEIVVATGLVHNRDLSGNFKIFSAFGWRVPNFGDMISNCFLSIYKIRRSILKNSNYYPMEYSKSDKIIKVEAVSGCFFSIKAVFLKDIGFFDESTFLYYEETILGYQIKSRGKYVMIDTTVPIYHCENLNKNRTFRQRYITDKRLLKSAIVYLRKYLQIRSFGVFIYSICFWIGKAETRLLNKLVRKH